jgi:two-component system phosphate regulon sensor histidine kinase PhoR
MFSYLLLVLLLCSGLYTYLAKSLESSITTGYRDHLQDEARVASLMAAAEVRDLGRDGPTLTARLARVIKARVTLIAPNGVVVADSEVPPGEVAQLEKHDDRPEVRAALALGIGSSIRYSATLHTKMLYTALPFGHKGVIRLALPLSGIELAKERLGRTLGVALAVALLASLFLSYILANVTSRNLRKVAAVALRIGRGEFGNRIPVTSSDELGELARIMNEMAGRIEGQMERISSEKNRLDAILKGMGEGVMVTDQHGVVTLVNPAFCAMFGSTDQVLGRELLEVSRHPELYAACRKVLSQQQELRHEIQLTGQAMLVHWVPLLEAGTLRGVVAVFHDISALKKAETIRRDFVANVSHELRTPITVIKGYAETLLSDSLEDDPQRREHFLAIILKHAQRLSTLIADLLTLSELESGERSVQVEEIQLEGALRHALILMGQRGEEEGITMESRVAGGAGTVQADPGRLDQVLINLLDNALKYSGRGGKVVIEAALEGDLVRISVKDSGIGIPGKDLPRLFERFYRVDEARSRDRGGTGLGLSIVKHIVQSLGGSVRVESTPGTGSIFSFTLPKGS